MQNVSLISGGCNTPGGACGIKADSISGGVINGKRSTEDIEKRNKRLLGSFILLF